MTTEYDTGTHAATVTGEIDGTEYSITCNGLSSCGEAFCEPSNPFDQYDDDGETDERYKDFEGLRAEAIREVKRQWNYNGSNWSEPVDDPDIELTSEADEDHQIEIARTEFHGGAVIGYAETQEDADVWIAHANQGTDCVCSCYETREVELSDE